MKFVVKIKVMALDDKIKLINLVTDAIHIGKPIEMMIVPPGMTDAQPALVVGVNPPTDELLLELT
jgi:hypothetical protein